MHVEQKSSGVAKAGLATGTVGASLGVLNMLGAGAGLLGLAGNRAVAYCNEDHLVDRYTLAQEAKIAKLETDIALRDANTFTDSKFIELYKYFDGELRNIRDTLAAQAVKNQSTADSFQMVTERMQCCCNSLEEKIKSERHERQCADNAIVNYANATFYPKMVADVTTGTTTTAQTLFNPLPVASCNCNC